MNFLSDLEALMRSQDNSISNVAEYLAKLGTPSTSTAVLDSGEITAQCFSTLKHDTETLFQACSISKPTAGVAVMKLVSQGKLDLDKPITEYLPPSSMELISTPPTRELLKYVTLRQLLSHTSGLSQGGFPGYASNPADLQSVLSGEPPCNTMQVHLEGFPGQRYCYSGGGMSVIQLIVETVTGRRLPEIVEELVFKPLGMTRSFYRIPNGEENYADAYYNGFMRCEAGHHLLVEEMAAGVWTTPTDLLKLVRAVQDSFNSSSDDNLLPQDTAKEMLTEIESNMALSWFAPAKPGISLSHTGGNDPGYRCFLLGYIDLHYNGALKENGERSGLCIMTNAREGDLVYMRIISAILYMKAWNTLPVSLQSSYFYRRVIPFYAPCKKIDEKWVGWKGEWDGGKWRMEEHEGGPFIAFGKLSPVKLLAVAMVEEEGEICLRTEGLEKLIRLTEEKGEKVVEIWHAGSWDTVILRR